ncbi:MAG: ABC transporter ATP-binding protein [Candidatus Gracilibacteria bacterium]
MLFEQKKKKSSTLSILKDLWQFTKPMRGDMYYAVGLIFLAQGASIIQPVFWKQMIDAIVQKQSLDSLVIIFEILIGLALVQSILNYLRQSQAHRFRWKGRLLLEQYGFEKMLQFSIGQHIEQGSGIKFAIYQNGVSGFTNMIQQLLYDVFPAVFTLVITMTVLFFISWELGLLLTVAVIARLWADIRYTNKYVKKPMKNMIDHMNKRWSHMKEVTREIETVKQFGREEAEATWLHNKFKFLRDLSNSIWIPSMKMQNIRQFLFQVFYYSILFLGAYFIFTGRFTPGYILLFTSWGGMVVGAVRDLTNFERDFIDNLVNAEKLLEMLRKEPVVSDNVLTSVPDKIQGHIVFSKMNFFYKEALEKMKDENATATKVDISLPLFTDFDLEIPAGKTTALVGHSGSGKSTLMKLLQRYYDVTGGHIAFDNIDIRDLPLTFLRKHIGIVPQDVRLFDGSLKENLLYGVSNSKEVSEKELEKIIKMACIDKFLERLPNGLESQIGENGIRLSGGEKQRVGIARALLKDPTILIFDEATSSLDSENEKLIQKAIKDVSKGRTTIIIAHRLSTIIHADKIVVLDKGKIAGEGTHKELMKNCIQYKRLVTIQMKDLLAAQMGDVSEEEVHLVLKDLKII